MYILSICHFSNNRYYSIYLGPFEVCILPEMQKKETNTTINTHEPERVRKNNPRNITDSKQMY